MSNMELTQNMIDYIVKYLSSTTERIILILPPSMPDISTYLPEDVLTRISTTHISKFPFNLSSSRELQFADHNVTFVSVSTPSLPILEHFQLSFWNASVCSITVFLSFTLHVQSLSYFDLTSGTLHPLNPLKSVVLSGKRIEDASSASDIVFLVYGSKCMMQAVFIFCLIVCRPSRCSTGHETSL